MPIYHKLGEIPDKRHIQFRKPNGDLYYEQLFGTIGFDGMSSLMYQHYRPTMVTELKESIDVTPKIAVEKSVKSRKLISFNVGAEDDFLDSRKTLLANNDVHVGVAAPRHSLRNYFYKNADADEMLFVIICYRIFRKLLFSLTFLVSSFTHFHSLFFQPS